jgi:hypothetical protein
LLLFVFSTDFPLWLIRSIKNFSLTFTSIHHDIFLIFSWLKLPIYVCVCYIRGPSDFWHNFSNRRVGYYSWNFKIKFSIVIKFFHLLSVYNNCKIKIKNKQWKNSLIIFIMTWYNQWPMLFTHVLLSLHFMQILFYLLKINILGYPRQSAGMMTSKYYFLLM